MATKSLQPIIRNFLVFLLLIPLWTFSRDAPLTTIGNVSACQGITTAIPVTVTGFSNVSAITLRIDYNPELVDFISYTNVNPAFIGMMVNDVAVSASLRKVIIVWSDINPITISDGSKLLDLNFSLLTSTSATISFNNISNGGQDCEYADENADPMNDSPTANFYYDGIFSGLSVGTAGAIAGLTNICAGDAGVTYSIDPVSNATGYSWTVPAGCIIATGQNTSQITVDFPDNTLSGNIEVYASNACGNSNISVLPIIVNPLPIPNIGADNLVCAGQTGVVYATEAGMTNYIWNVTGGMITSGGTTLDRTATVAWGEAGNGTVSVNYTNGNGCTALSPTIFNVTINPPPVPVISGDNSVCAGESGVVYTTMAGMDNYVWSATGGTITAGGTLLSNSVTVTWNTAGAGTVSVNYSNENGCRAVLPTIYNVTINQLPVPTIVGDNTVCAGEMGVVYTTESSMTSYIWNVTGGTITAGGTPTSNTATVTWNVAGAGTVSINYTNGNGCSAVAATVYNVAINPMPVPTIIGDNYVCAGEAGVVYTTQAGMTGYVWSVTDGTIIAGGTSTSNTATITWNTEGSGAVGVNYINGNGCSAESPAVFSVLIIPLPVPPIGGDNNVCVGETGVVYTTQDGVYNYVWNVTGGTITAGGTSTSNTVTVAWNVAGLGTVSVNYTNSDGCSAAAPTVYNVTINPLPIPAITGDDIVCSGETGVVYTTQAGMTGYVWNVTGGTITAGGTPTSNTANVTWNSAGAGTVSVNYSNENGCRAVLPTIYNVTINPLPIPTIAGDNSVCAGETGFIYATQAGMTGYTWNVTGGTITAGGTPTSNTATVTWNAAGAGTVSVNYTNGNGCSALAITNYNVTINPLPVPTIAGDNSVCAGETSVVYSTEAGMTNYIWNVTGGTFISGGTSLNQTATVAWGEAGNGTVSVNYTNSNGCTASSSTIYNVTINPLPVPVISGDNSVCIGESGVVYTTMAGMDNYVWSVTGGIITAGGTLLSNSVTVTWTTAGVGTVSVNYSNENGCSAVLPTIYNVTINPLPVPTIAGGNTVCAGEMGVVYTTESSMTSYIWSITGGTITAGGTPTSNTATVTWNAPGVGTVSVNYANGNGCSAVEATVYNVAINPMPVPTIAGENAVCFEYGVEVYTTEAGMTSYSWNVTGGAILSGGSTTSNTATVAWDVVGEGSVSVNYTNGNGCSALTPTVYNVTVNPLPIPTIAGDNSVCVGESGVVYTTQPGMTDYVWHVIGGTITAGGTMTSNTATVTWDIAGVGKVGVNYTNGNGCSAVGTSYYNITVNPLPVPSITGDFDVCIGNAGVEYVYTYTTESGMTNYSWNVTGGTVISGGDATSSFVNILWTALGSGTISVQYTNGNGCIAIVPAIQSVTVNPLPINSLSGDNVVCVGDAGVIYTTVPGMVEYSWIVSGGTITSGGTSNSNTATVTWNTAGSNYIRVSYTNANGCSNGYIQYSITVNPLPVPIISGDNSVCIGDAGIVYATDAGMTAYDWNITGGTITVGGTPTSNTATVSWNIAGAGTVSVNYTNGNGCSALVPTSYNVTVNPLPVPSISGDNSVYVGQTGAIYTTEAGMTGYGWNVTGGTITSGGTSSSNTATITWNTLGEGTVSVNYINGNGCFANNPTIYNVTINALPVPSLSGEVLLCEGDPLKSYATDYGMTGYVWNVTGGTIVAGGTTIDPVATVNWGTAGTGSISVSYLVETGIQSTTTVLDVEIIPLPEPTIVGDNSVCAGDAGLVYTTEPYMMSYSWNVIGGTIISGGTYSSNEITVNWNSAGNGSVSVLYVNGYSCFAPEPTVYNVTINPRPVPVISGDNSVCIGDAGLVYTTEAGMINYVWNVNGGTITAGGTSTSNSVTVTWNTLGIRNISVGYTNGNGCFAAVPTVYNITVNPLPVPSIMGDYTVCLGDIGVVYSTEPGMTNYSWNVTGGVITSGGTSTSNTVTISWNTVGSGSVGVNYTNGNGCTAILPTVSSVTVNPLPVPTISGDNVVCAGDAGVVYTTELGMMVYNWSVIGGTITSGGEPTSNTATITWNTAGVQSVIVSYTNGDYCTSIPVTYNVTVNPLPVPVITGDNSVCIGDVGLVYNSEPGMTNYIWNVTGGVITAGGTPTSNTATVTWNVAGVGTASVTYTNGNGCSAAVPTVYIVSVNPLPVPTISGDNNVCAGESSVVYSTEAGMTDYAWNVTGGIITAGGTPTSNTATVTWNSAGAGTIGASYTNTYGCSAVAATVYDVTINTLPVPVISGENIVCSGEAGVVYTTEAGMTNYIWNVTGGTITAGGTLTSNTATITWNAAGAGTVSVNYSNVNGCSAIAPTIYNVMVNSLPLPIISGDNSVCNGDAGLVYITESGMSGYIWSVTGGTITSGGTSTSNTATVTWNVSGTGTVSVNYTNGNGCSAYTPTVYNVTVNPLPDPTISGDNSVCIDDAGVVYATEAGMTNYIWSVTGGTITTGGTSTSNTATITWNSLGAGTVSVGYSNGNGCIAAAPTLYNIVVNPLPVPSISGDNTVCFEETGVVYTTEPGMTNYMWNVTGGIITSGGNSSSNTATVHWNTLGSGTISVNYTNGNGCLGAESTIFNVTINSLPVPTLSGENTVCMGDAGIIYTTESGMAGYVWNVTGGTITAGGNATSNTATVTWTTAGTGSISVNYANANGCTAITPTILNVTVNSLPVPVITGDITVCEGSTGDTYTTESGMTEYLWVISSDGVILAGGTPTDNTVTVVWPTPGSKTISVNYTNSNGCTASNATVLAITVNELPVPEITGNDNVCTTYPEIYTTATGMQSYLWIVTGGEIISGGTSTSSEVTVVWNEPGTGNVSVEYTVPNGCPAGSPGEMEVNITISPETAGVTTGETIVCEEQTEVAYSIDPIVNATGYVWSLPQGAEIVSGTNTNAIIVTYSSGAQSGDITVYGTNSNCSGGVSDPLFITVNVKPEAALITYQDGVLSSDQPIGNQWYFEGALIEGATDATYVPLENGNYYVVVTLDNCSSESSNVINVLDVSVKEMINAGLILFPNPSTGEVRLLCETFAAEDISVQVINNTGAVVWEKRYSDPPIELNELIDLNQHKPGMYLLRLTVDGAEISKKIVLVR